MEVQVTREQEAFIREAIAAGRVQSEEDAFGQAMSLWEARERRRLEILAAVEMAEGSLARGEGRRVTSPEEARQLAEDVKRRGRERVATQQQFG